MAQVKIKHFAIDQIKDSSAVFSGVNAQYHFSSATYKAEGNGTIDGNHNLIFNNIHMVKNNKPTSENE
ncbi:hypothetical protein [Cytobacillus praedii]|uniref:hypothetical protein n=1 Tax=Cytobacillus praedii TaxID=1742358 RepID=UPI00070E01AF|nr:hypothetical protein [Cytobacillus praedii]